MTGTNYAEDLGRGVGQIRLPLPFPGLRWTNAYVIRGDRGLTLIDCGVDDGPTLDALEKGLAELGHGLDAVTTVVASHMHPDHMGLAHRLVAEGARLTMHESAAAVIDRYNDWSITRRRLAKLAAEHGAPGEFVARTAAVEPRPAWAGRAVMPDTFVKDGEQIVIDEDRTLTAIHTPGHEISHICLLDSKTQVLFSGDHVLPRITPVVMYGDEPDPLGTYLESLGRIESMDIDVTYPAHVDILDRGSLRARQIILHHERRLGAIAQEVRATAKTAWQLVGEIFRPHLNPLEERLAFAETLAHLEYLRLRDELMRSNEGGVWHYYAARRWRPGP